MAKCRTVGTLTRSTTYHIAERVYKRIRLSERWELLLFVREGEACISQTGARELMDRLCVEHPEWVVCLYNKHTALRDIIDDLYFWMQK